MYFNAGYSPINRAGRLAKRSGAEAAFIAHTDMHDLSVSDTAAMSFANQSVRKGQKKAILPA